MGMFDDALKDAVPGGNLTKPLVIAAGALILSKWLSGSGQPSQPEIIPPAKPAPAPQSPAWGKGAPTIEANHSDDGLAGGLGGLIDKLRNGGLADAANSWVQNGPNQQVTPQQLGPALGQQTISDLAKQAGVSEQDLLAMLTQALPGLVDKLTPQGRLPTQAEVGGYRR